MGLTRYWATGIAALGLGLAKAFTTASAQGVILDMPRCIGGATHLVRISEPSLAHCWGCYVAGAGAVLLLYAAWRSLRRVAATA